MAGWLSRLTGGGSDAAVAERSSKEDEDKRAAETEKAVVPPAAFGARRPLLASSGEVAGFEFRLVEKLEQRMAESEDLSAESKYAVALLASMRSTAETNRIAMASLPAALLARSAIADQAPRNAMLCALNPLADNAIERNGFARLQARGIRLGFEETADPALIATADFVVIKPVKGNVDALIASAERWAASKSGLTIVASGMDSIEDLERVMRSGVSFATGVYEQNGKTMERKPLRPATQRLYQLLNHITVDPDNTRIVEAMRADVALSYRLLRYLNSPAVGLSREIDSIEQGVVMLGRKELHRWLSVMLLAAADGRKASRALQEIALSRGRFLEELARKQDEESPDAFFTMGMMSMLDVMLQMPLAEALKPLGLNDLAMQALLEKRGPWRPYLELAILLERHDMAAAAPIAEQFGGLDAVLELSSESWAWAATVCSEMRS